MNDPRGLFDELAEWATRGIRAAPGHANTAAVRDYIISSVRDSTIFRQYSKRFDLADRDVGVRNTLPWHAEGERQAASILLAAAGRTDGPRLLNGGTTELEQVEAESVGVTAAAAALHGSLYLWNGDVEDIADAAPLPKHVISPSVMLHPVMFWSRDCARLLPEGGENNWWLLIRTPRGVTVYGDRTFLGRMDIGVAGIPFGKVFPDHFPTSDREGIRRLLARLAFLNSPYIGADAGRLPRAWRREASRTGQAAVQHDPLINVVQLRRDARESVQREREASGQSINWRHQWWVSGHYRAQWYPSEEAHKVIWIAPYLKGPADLPIAQKVYAVVR